MKKTALRIAGVFLILLGIIGLFLPVLQGGLLIFAGLALLAPRLARAIRLKLLGPNLKAPTVSFKNWEKSGVFFGFGTRHFPVKLAKTQDLDIPEIRLAVLHSLPEAKRLAYAHQVHGEVMVVVEHEDVRGGFFYAGEADALITQVPELHLLILTADCLPIFFKAGNWVAIAHAGWRGTQKNLAPKVLCALEEKSGLPLSETDVFLGPCIGPQEYQVGPEFETYFPASVRREKGNLYFDLAAENRRQLLECGASKSRVKTAELCTVEQNADLYSFRKEKESAGRLVSWIVKKPIQGIS